MSKRALIILTTLALLVGIVGAWNLIYNDTASAPTAANAPVVTGVSLVFDRQLTVDARAIITDSQKKTVKTEPLPKNAQRYNIELPPGVYQVHIEAKGDKFPPTPELNVAVQAGTLAESAISIPLTNPED